MLEGSWYRFVKHVGWRHIIGVVFQENLNKIVLTPEKFQSGLFLRLIRPQQRQNLFYIQLLMTSLLLI